ncbi:type II toxin-antitoxin system RelE/ParE family toxin [Candidatus Poribacteria bacterium]|nr:type II toxin-antitoxin system RelE/ParE family toxin [Candidatus Poribacteria bacterium]
MYRVSIKPSALDDLKRIPPPARARIQRKIRSLSMNPRPRGVKKLTNEANSYRVRAGDYRVLYEIDDAEGSVRVFVIDHRKAAYR